MGYLLITVLASGNEVTSLIGGTEGEKIGMGLVYCDGSMQRCLAAFQDMMTPVDIYMHIFLMLASMKVKNNWELAYWFHDVTICCSWRNFRW